jgi:cob(I)alamin adenosyltransferase
LREEIFVLQKEYNKHRLENQKLTDIHDNLEEENEQYEKFIQENECFWLESNNQESTLLASLRK